MPTATTLVGFQRSGEKDVQDVNPRVTTGAIRVAVVEDHERLRRALVFQLGSAGFRVAQHSSAEEFLKATGAGAFDCIVVDLFLPRMNGLQLQAELHRTAPFASIVFISGHGDLSLGMHAMRKGAVDFLEKPLDDEAFLSSIVRGADLSRKGRAEHAQRIKLEERQCALTPREREVLLEHLRRVSRCLILRRAAPRRDDKNGKRILAREIRNAG